MVMVEGLKNCSIAKLEKEVGADGKPKSTWQVCLRPIPEDQADKVTYHNELMILCALFLRQLTDALQQGSGKYNPAAQFRDRSRSPRGGSRES